MGDGSVFRMGLLAAFFASQGACVGHDDACGGPTSDFPYCGEDGQPGREEGEEDEGVTGGSPPPAAEPGAPVGMDAGSAADPDESNADGGVEADAGSDASVIENDCAVDTEGGIEGEGGADGGCETAPVVGNKSDESTKAPD